MNAPKVESFFNDAHMLWAFLYEFVKMMLRLVIKQFFFGGGGLMEFFPEETII